MPSKLKALGWQVPFAAVLLFLGFMLSVQFRTQQTMSTALEYQSTENLVSMWKQLATKGDNLRQEIRLLQAKESLLAQQSAQGRTARENMEQDLKQLQAASGLAPVQGPGISVTLTSDAPLLHLDLVDLVNELWASGAEAIAINDRRVTGMSAIGELRQGEAYHLTLDGRRLAYPVVIRAIGDPNTLEKGLTFTGGLIDNFNTLYSIYPRIEKHQRMVLPATAPADWRYARPVAAGVPSTQPLSAEQTRQQPERRIFLRGAAKNFAWLCQAAPPGCPCPLEFGPPLV